MIAIGDFDGAPFTSIMCPKIRYISWDSDDSASDSDLQTTTAAYKCETAKVSFECEIMMAEVSPPKRVTLRPASFISTRKKSTHKTAPQLSSTDSQSTSTTLVPASRTPGTAAVEIIYSSCYNSLDLGDFASVMMISSKILSASADAPFTRITPLRMLQHPSRFTKVFVKSLAMCTIINYLR